MTTEPSANVWPEGAISTQGLTPGRQTRLILDPDLTHSLLEGQWGGLRMGPQIAPPVAHQRSAESKWHRATHLWASGGWTLRPLQLQLSRVQEKGLPASVIFQPSSVGGTSASLKLDCDSRVTTRAMWAQKSGSGLTAGTGVNASGSDLMFGREITAGGSWASDLAGMPAELSALSTALAAWKPLTYPLQPIAASQQSQAADTGYCIRLWVPGSPGMSYPDYVGAFHFGQYALVLGGDGIARLMEYKKVGAARSWEMRKAFRWSAQSQVVGHAHVILIYPHVGPQGQKYIVFATPMLDGATPADLGDASFGATASRGGALPTGEIVYRWDFALAGGEDLAGDGHATAAGKIYLQERADLRCRWQISRLAWETSGTVIDLPWAMDRAFTARTISVNRIERVPGTTTLSHAVADAYDAGLTGNNIADPFVTFTFAGDGATTPILWGYKINRQPVIGSRTGASLSVPIIGAFVGLGESDPRAENVDVTVEDPLDAYSRLRHRGELDCRLQTNYVPRGTETIYTVNLFRGVILRPQRTKKGKADVSARDGTPIDFPSPEWSKYQCTGAGMWHHLCQTSTRTALSFENFAFDSSAGLDAQGNQQPWKVTDAIRVLLKSAGFPDSMVDIEDLDIRLWAGAGADISDQILDPGTNIAAQVVRLAQAYLGRFLVFDPNAGDLDTLSAPIGAWKLIGAPAADSTALLAFTTAGPGAGKVLSLPAYDASPVPVVPVLGEPESHTEPPEKNHIWAFSVASLGGSSGIRVDNHVYNYQSYAVPGSGVVLDPENPHYIGHERLMVVGDPSLWGGAAAGGYQATQTVLDFVLDRLFVYTCLARKVLVFDAPLEMVYDAGLGRYRPPRYYDHVTYNGADFFIRSVDIRIDLGDAHQMATYTLEQIIPYPYNP